MSLKIRTREGHQDAGTQILARPPLVCSTYPITNTHFRVDRIGRQQCIRLTSRGSPGSRHADRFMSVPFEVTIHAGTLNHACILFRFPNLKFTQYAVILSLRNLEEWCRTTRAGLFDFFCIFSRLANLKCVLESMFPKQIFPQRLRSIRKSTDDHSSIHSRNQIKIEHSMVR